MTTNNITNGGRNSSASSTSLTLSTNAGQRPRRSTLSFDHNHTDAIHTWSIEELEHYFRTDLCCGLDSEYAEYLLSENGLNTLTPPKKDSNLIKWFKHVFGGIFNILLWVASVGLIAVFVFIQQSRDNSDLLVPITLITVIISSGTFQFFQEIKSEKIMSSFSKFQPSTVIVLRDGKEIEILPQHLVNGDIILLSSGNKISCDIIIIESSSDLFVDNSSLTGESEPQNRSNKCTNLDLMNTENVLFFGTSLLKGKAKGIVYKTGDDTFLGQIAKSSFEKGIKNKTESVFEHEIQHFVKMISWIAILIGIIFVIFDISNGVSFQLTIVFAISIIVANIPEGLLPTVTLALTLSAHRMRRKHVLIRNLQSVETLGCVSVICSDKTGTITTGKMSVSHVYVTNNNNNQNIEVLQSRKLMRKIRNESYSYFKLFRVAILCNNAHIETNENNHYKIKGYPTETGILRASIPIIGGIDEMNKIKENYPIVHEIPFNSENKWHLTIHDKNSQNKEYLLTIKGAPEVILDLCGYYYDENNAKVALNDEMRDLIINNVTQTAELGERVLCFAESTFELELDGCDSFEFNGESFESANWFIEASRGGSAKLVFIGFMSLIDPPRKEVAESISLCNAAGIKVVMITGDHKITATAIAKHVGIIKEENIESKENVVIDFGMKSKSKVVTGSEIDQLESKTDWDHILLSYEYLVFARTTPYHKQIIVEEFQKRGFIVAVTGDGVNDAPALNVANVGISMGVNGTDVARESSDMILMNDNFASICHGIFEGRLISENLKKSVVYTLCSKLPQLLPVILKNVFGLPLALTMRQILLIDLATDIWTGVAMAYEKPEDNLMSQKPRNIYKNPLVSWKMLLYSYLHIGVIQTLGCFLAFQQMFYDNGNGINLYSDLKNISKTEWKENFMRETLFCYDNGKGCRFDQYANLKYEFNHEINPSQQIILVQRAQTAYYISLILMQIVTAICCETRINSIILKHGFFTNKYLSICLFLELLFGICIVYIPALQNIFGTQPLELACWFSVTPFMILLFVIEELRKYYVRKHIKQNKTNWFMNIITW